MKKLIKKSDGVLPADNRKTLEPGVPPADRTRQATFFDNYTQLTTRVDALCTAIAVTLGDQIACQAGCSSCCTAITIFPVEAAAMAEALENMPEQQGEKIRRHIAKHVDQERCPLLVDHRCILYEARPIICRTHGLPVVYSSDGQHKSDCCPLNLVETKTVSGSNAIDLDKLNTLLVAVNSIYLTQTDSFDAGSRVTIADALARL